MLDFDGPLRGNARTRLRLLWLAISCSVAGLLAGCGSNSPKPVVGAIVVADSFGKPVPTVSSLAPGAPVYVMAIVSDDGLLGADWTVTCSDEAPAGTLPAGNPDLACGSFSPRHTMSGPVPGYAQNGAGYLAQYTAPAQRPKAGTVTIIATSTLLPARTRRLTLNID